MEERTRSVTKRNTEGDFVNHQPALPGLCARRTGWPSAASCAFVASGLELLSFGLTRYVLAPAIAAVREHAVLPSGPIYLGLAMWVIDMAAQARALWGVARRQQAVSPVTARCGKWAFAAYVVVSGLMYILMPVVLVAFGRWSVRVFRVGNGVVETLSTLAFGCLGWASRSDSGSWQRWASRGLLVVTMFGVFSVIGNLFGLPTGQRWLWLAPLQVAVRAAMWAVVGAWLRSVTVVLSLNNEHSNPNLETQD